MKFLKVRPTPPINSFNLNSHSSVAIKTQTITSMVKSLSQFKSPSASQVLSKLLIQRGEFSRKVKRREVLRIRQVVSWAGSSGHCVAGEVRKTIKIKRAKKIRCFLLLRVLPKNKHRQPIINVRIRPWNLSKSKKIRMLLTQIKHRPRKMRR